MKNLTIFLLIFMFIFAYDIAYAYKTYEFIWKLAIVKDVLKSANHACCKVIFSDIVVKSVVS